MSGGPSTETVNSSSSSTFWNFVRTAITALVGGKAKPADDDIINHRSPENPPLHTQQRQPRLASPATFWKLPPEIVALERRRAPCATGRPGGRQCSSSDSRTAAASAAVHSDNKLTSSARGFSSPFDSCSTPVQADDSAQPTTQQLPTADLQRQQTSNGSYRLIPPPLGRSYTFPSPPSSQFPTTNVNDDFYYGAPPAGSSNVATTYFRTPSPTPGDYSPIRQHLIVPQSAATFSSAGCSHRSKSVVDFASLRVQHQQQQLLQSSTTPPPSTTTPSLHSLLASLFGQPPLQQQLRHTHTAPEAQFNSLLRDHPLLRRDVSDTICSASCNTPLFLRRGLGAGTQLIENAETTVSRQITSLSCSDCGGLEIEIQSAVRPDWVIGTESGLIRQIAPAVSTPAPLRPSSYLAALLIPISDRRRHLPSRYYYFGSTDTKRTRHGWGSLVAGRRLLYEGEWHRGRASGLYVLRHEFSMEIGCRSRRRLFRASSTTRTTATSIVGVCIGSDRLCTVYRLVGSRDSEQDIWSGGGSYEAYDPSSSEGVPVQLLSPYTNLDCPYEDRVIHDQIRHIWATTTATAVVRSSTRRYTAGRARRYQRPSGIIAASVVTTQSVTTPPAPFAVSTTEASEFQRCQRFYRSRSSCHLPKESRPACARAAFDGLAGGGSTEAPGRLSKGAATSAYERLLFAIASETPGYLRAAHCAHWTPNQVCLFFLLTGAPPTLALMLQLRQISGRELLAFSEADFERSLGSIISGCRTPQRHLRCFLLATIRALALCAITDASPLRPSLRKYHRWWHACCCSYGQPTLPSSLEISPDSLEFDARPALGRGGYATVVSGVWRRQVVEESAMRAVAVPVAVKLFGGGGIRLRASSKTAAAAVVTTTTASETPTEVAATAAAAPGTANRPDLQRTSTEPPLCSTTGHAAAESDPAATTAATAPPTTTPTTPPTIQLNSRILMAFHTPAPTSSSGGLYPLDRRSNRASLRAAAGTATTTTTTAAAGRLHRRVGKEGKSAFALRKQFHPRSLCINRRYRKGLSDGGVCRQRSSRTFCRRRQRQRSDPTGPVLPGVGIAAAEPICCSSGMSASTSNSSSSACGGGSSARHAAIAPRLLLGGASGRATAIKNRNHELEMLVHAGPHPHVVELYGRVDFSSFGGEDHHPDYHVKEHDDGYGFNCGIVLERCDGGSLDKSAITISEKHHNNLLLLRRSTSSALGGVRSDGSPHVRPRRSRPELLRLFAEAASAMAHLHRRGILHRDIKLSNILVGSDQRARISDLGMSAIVDDPAEDSPVTLAVYGSVFYAAPEVLRGDGFYPQSDVYSFGVALWEALHARLAFDGVSPNLLYVRLAADEISLPLDNGHIPKQIRSLLQQMLHRDWRRRPLFSAVAAALRRISLRSTQSAMSDLESFMYGEASATAAL